MIRKKILLTEGKSDKNFNIAIWNAHHSDDVIKSDQENEKSGTTNPFEIEYCGTDEKVLDSFEAKLISSTKHKTIGIVIDADNKPDKRWKGIMKVLESCNIKGYPHKAQKEGTIIPETSDTPRIGIWVMPDNLSQGMLEDFCIKIAPKEHVRFASLCVDIATKFKYSSYIENHYQKAVVHTYLAWQKDPGLSLGLSIKAKKLDSQHPLAKTFGQWLEKLFNTPNHSTD